MFNLSSATHEQKSAVLNNGSMLVSAAAGSGKTAVLVERVIEKIAPSQNDRNPVMADRLLIVTFTDAAAAEMRARIEKRLYDEIEKHPEKEYLERQKHLLQSADICTIDSFCIRILRDNFSVLGISPDFSVGDGSELTFKKAEIINEILAPLFEENSEEFKYLLELTSCEYDEKNLCNLIDKTFEKSMLSPFPEVFFDNLIKPFKTAFSEEHLWYKELFSYLKSSAEDLLDIAAKIAETAEKTVKYDNFIKFGKETVNEVSNLYAVIKENNLDSVKIAIEDFKIPTQPNSSKTDKASLEIKELKTILSDKIDKLKKNIIFNQEQTEELRKRILPSVELFIDICLKFKQKYYELCLKENYFTFSFCEQLVRELICKNINGKPQKTEFADRIISKYDEVMVDEYQDVNDLQDMLFKIISDNDDHLFTVGDVKQSIYGFRGSNPKNFLNKKEFAEQEDTTTEKVILSNNFRSRKCVCDAVNFIFNLLLNGQTGSIVYGREEQLEYSAKFPIPDMNASEVLILDNSESETERLDSEGEAIADYIIKTMAEGNIIKDKINDEDALRPAKYSDFTILMRSVNEKAAHIANALISRGIPVSYPSESFTETFEVNLILSLLKAIDNPKSDVEVFTVLLSPLFSFTADDLAEIRAGNNRESLYSSLIKSAEKKDGKVKEFLSFLSRFRRVFAVLPVGEGIAELYAQTDILNLVSVMPNGSEKRANLLSLQKIADKYSDTQNGSIYGFLRYIFSLPDNSFKKTKLSQNGVKIMSMHKSKGLQFPVCILANLTNKINNQDAADSVLLSEKYGIAFNYFDEKLKDKYKMVNHFLAAEQIRDNNLDEELRLLYVAATRAEDRVCFVCSLNKAESALTSIAGRLSDTPPFISNYAIKKCNSMGNLLLSCLLLNKGSRELKDSFGITSPEIESDFIFKVNFIKSVEKDKCESRKVDDVFVGNKDLANKIVSNFSYRYPFENILGIEAKVSVSSAANGEEAERFAFTSKPEFMYENGLSAAGRGTAMHHVMQYISFEEGVTVEQEIERLKEWQFITESEAAVIDIEAIKKFFNSDIFGRIKNADEVKREMRFLSYVPALKIDENAGDLPDDTNVLIQGAVDLLFIENGEITVLDFKTDRVDSFDVLKERYKEQLSIYSTACEKIIGLPIKEKIIYSFTLNSYCKI